jgi:hypothetical protein
MSPAPHHASLEPQCHQDGSPCGHCSQAAAQRIKGIAIKRLRAFNDEYTHKYHTNYLNIVKEAFEVSYRATGCMQGVMWPRGGGALGIRAGIVQGVVH